MRAACGEGSNPLPAERLILAVLLRRGQRISVTTVATAAMVFLLGGRESKQARIFANTADENRTRGQCFEDGVIGEGSIGADQQLPLRISFINHMPECLDTLGAFGADGGRS
jgi:hypothetical protein